jgi:glucose/arabinose dehydrogenase
MTETTRLHRWSRPRWSSMFLGLALVTASCGDDTGSSGDTSQPVSTETTTITLEVTTQLPTTTIAATTTRPPTTVVATTVPPATAAPTTSGGNTTPTTRTTVARSTTKPTTTKPPTTTTASAPGDPRSLKLQLTEVARFTEPIAISSRPGDPTIYVAERGGRIKAVRNGAVVATPMLEFSDRTKAEGERGLLGFAIAPDGAHAYLHFTDLPGNSHVVEFTMAADGTIDRSSERELLAQVQPYANHNGGHITFGPDKLLYVGFGDGGSGGDPENRAQNLGTWLGKILRIDPRPGPNAPYQIPADNPFVGRPGALGEIWSYGLRNPWRFTFDPANGDLWIGDVGQNEFEEVDLAPAANGGGRGVNFGWRRFEGNATYNQSTDAPGAVGPLFTAGRDAGTCSITGGEVYRGRAISALNGVYILADLCWDELRAWTPQHSTVALKVGTGNPVSIQHGPDGELYICDLDGPLLRLDAA